MSALWPMDRLHKTLQAKDIRVAIIAVPVEADGSAYFEAPVGKPIYFQALDGQGMAVQSMRSVTWSARPAAVGRGPAPHRVVARLQL